MLMPIEVELDDVDQLCEIATMTTAEPASYSMTFRQMSAGSCRSRYRSVEYDWDSLASSAFAQPLFQPAAEYWSPEMELRGAAPPTNPGFIMAQGREPFHCNGIEITQGQLMVVRPGEELELTTPANFRFMGIHFDTTLSSDLSLGAEMEIDLASARVLRPAQSEWQALVRSVTDWLDAPDRHCFVGDRCASERTASVIDSALNALLSHRDLPRRPSLPACRRRELARRARDYMEENLDRALSRTELCTLAGTPSRSLDAAFRELYGASPVAYHRLIRLNRVRGELKSRDARESTVSEVACDFGFNHFGRFSGTYKALFGETPSATLRARVA